MINTHEIRKTHPEDYERFYKHLLSEDAGSRIKAWAIHCIARLEDKRSVDFFVKVLEQTSPSSMFEWDIVINCLAGLADEVFTISSQSELRRRFLRELGRHRETATSALASDAERSSDFSRYSRFFEVKFKNFTTIIDLLNGYSTNFPGPKPVADAIRQANDLLTASHLESKTMSEKELEDTFILSLLVASFVSCNSIEIRRKAWIVCVGHSPVDAAAALLEWFGEEWTPSEITDESEIAVFLTELIALLPVLDNLSKADVATGQAPMIEYGGNSVLNTRFHDESYDINAVKENVISLAQRSLFVADEPVWEKICDALVNYDWSLACKSLTDITNTQVESSPVGAITYVQTLIRMLDYAILSRTSEEVNHLATRITSLLDIKHLGLSWTVLSGLPVDQYYRIVAHLNKMCGTLILDSGIQNSQLYGEWVVAYVAAASEAPLELGESEIDSSCLLSLVGKVRPQLQRMVFLFWIKMDTIAFS